MNQLYQFRFHTGSIKSHIQLCLKSVVSRFRFHTGSIKSLPIHQ